MENKLLKQRKEEIIEGFRNNTKHLSYSSLKEFAKSPSSFMQYQLRERVQTDAMMEGIIFHTLVLEPEKAKDKFYTDAEIVASIGGAKPRATKAYKEWRAQQILERPKAILIGADKLQSLEQMANAVRFNPVSRKLLEGEGQNEMNLEFEYGGFKFKGAIDRKTDNFIMDLKKTKDADPNRFKRDFFNLSYHIQSALYTIGNEEDLPYYVVAADSNMQVSVYEVGDSLIQKGFEIIDNLLKDFKICLEKGSFEDSYDFRGEKKGMYFIDTPPWL